MTTDRKPGPGEEYAWQKEERERGMTVSDYKTRDVWGGHEIVSKR